jgi:hypothetical protein
MKGAMAVNLYNYNGAREDDYFGDSIKPEQLIRTSLMLY